MLKSCLEGSALDLYLSLDINEQHDLDGLEKIFQEHFKPLKHSLIETESFMKMKKLDSQSVSEFHTALRKKANESLMDKSLTRIAFIQGLPPDHQKHCVLQKAHSLQEYLEKARDYEKIANIGSNSAKVATTNLIDNNHLRKLDTVFDLLNNQEGSNNGKSNGNHNHNGNHKNNGNHNHNGNHKHNGNHNHNGNRNQSN